MKAEIIATGSELLITKADTNTLFISRHLASLGIEVRFITIVGDEEADLEEAIRRARERVDLTVITGGLGPTVDDITKKVVARVTNRRLVLREEILRKISDRFAAQGREMPHSHEGLALLPSLAQMLENPVGTACGFLLQEEKGILLSLPGVPQEVEAMLPQTVLPALQQLLGLTAPLQRRRLRTTGLQEFQVDEILKGLHLNGYPVRVGLIAQEGGVDIQLQYSGKNEEEGKVLLEQIEREFQKNLGEALYGIDDETLERKVGKLLTQLNLTLAVAESCTGGLITHRLTNVPGSSDYLERAVISYSNRSKEEILGISPQTLRDYGAVSPQTATAMAEGIRRLARSDIGLSVTGIAGPGGGTEEKPVGLVYIALAYGAETRCHRYQLHGNRTTIKRRSAQTALDNLRRYLLSVTMNAS